MTGAILGAVLAAGSVLIGLWAMVKASSEYEHGFQHGLEAHHKELERFGQDRAQAIGVLVEATIYKVASREMSISSAQTIVMEGVEHGYPRMLALYKAHERKAVEPETES